LGQSKRRWLSFLHAVQKITHIFPALTSYYLPLEKCPVNLHNFFENPLLFTLLHFLANKLKTFSHTIIYFEKHDTTVIEAKNEISKLLDKLNCGKRDFLKLL
jgi:hypothetical protein